MFDLRPDIWKRLRNFSIPLKDDIDVDLLITLYKQKLLPEEYRKGFVQEVREAAIEFVDSSFLEYEDIAIVITESETVVARDIPRFHSAYLLQEMQESLILTPAYDIFPQGRTGNEATQAMLISGKNNLS